MKNGDKTNIPIKISPYIFNQDISYLIVFHFSSLSPLLFNYLKHVIGGLKWYAENDTPVKSAINLVKTFIFLNRKIQYFNYEKYCSHSFDFQCYNYALYRAVFG